MCAVTAGEESDHALDLGVELSSRLGLRLVLAHAVPAADDRYDGADGRKLSAAEHERAMQRLARLADDHGVADHAERRVAVGDPALLLGRIAAEEAADVVVVGAAERRWWRGFDLGLVRELETATPAAVVVALSRRRRGRRNGHRR